MSGLIEETWTGLGMQQKNSHNKSSKKERDKMTRLFVEPSNSLDSEFMDITLLLTST